MNTKEFREYLKNNSFRLTPLEFIALVNSSQEIIDNISLEPNSAIYKIKTKQGNNICVEVIEEPPVKKMTLKKDNN